MARMGRPGMPEERKQELWDRWRAGESISQISVALAKPPGSVFTILRHHGGIAPTPHKRRPQFLALAEREEISRGLASGKSLRQIARDLKRAPSTISREVKRNKGARHYRAACADDRAWRRAQRHRPCRLAENEKLRAFVAGRLADDWSPQQIAGHLAKHHPVGSHMRISHETIYKSLFIQTRGVLKRELQQHLRSKRPIRRHKNSSTKGQRRAEIIGAVSIRERPAEVEDRAIPGHWESQCCCQGPSRKVCRLALGIRSGLAASPR